MRWKRFRSDDAAYWANREDWPAGDEDVVLVYNPCDGFHLWNRYDEFTPPGAHFAKLKRPEHVRAAHRERIRRMYEAAS